MTLPDALVTGARWALRRSVRARESCCAARVGTARGLWLRTGRSADRSRSRSGHARERRWDSSVAIRCRAESMSSPEAPFGKANSMLTRPSNPWTM